MTSNHDQPTQTFASIGIDIGKECHHIPILWVLYSQIAFHEHAPPVTILDAAEAHACPRRVVPCHRPPGSVFTLLACL